MVNDVIMGSLDSAEVCELAGLFLLNNIEDLLLQQDVGLYRDDGLAVTSLYEKKLKSIVSQLK